jgi:hypothetical protein
MTEDMSLDAILQRQMERDDTDRLKRGLQIIDGLNRHGLLYAMDWTSADAGKMNTHRLRSKARLRWIAQGPYPTIYDLWEAQKVE